jgi:hypothetical protein
MLSHHLCLQSCGLHGHVPVSQQLVCGVPCALKRQLGLFSPTDLGPQQEEARRGRLRGTPGRTRDHYTALAQHNESHRVQWSSPWHEMRGGHQCFAALQLPRTSACASWVSLMTTRLSCRARRRATSLWAAAMAFAALSIAKGAWAGGNHIRGMPRRVHHHKAQRKSLTHHMCCTSPDYRLRIRSQGYERHRASVRGNSLFEKFIRTVHSAF